MCNDEWVAGFTSAEGCFFIQIYKAKTKQDEAVNLVYQLTQHTTPIPPPTHWVWGGAYGGGRDEQLMRSILKYLDCGGIYKNRTWFDLKVTKYRDIADKIIPLFKKYPILGPPPPVLPIIFLLKKIIWGNTGGGGLKL